MGHTRDINNNDNNDNILYLNLFNKYNARMREINYWKDKIKIIGELREEEDYLKLSFEEQDKLFKELM